MAPATANAMGAFVAAALPETSIGAGVLEGGGRVVGIVVVDGGALKVEVLGIGIVEYTVPPLVVWVTSEGKVTTSTVGTLVAIVIGTKTVAFVVGGSNVDVIV